MNPLLDRLQPYPFERLARLKAGLTPPAHLDHIALSMGEPQHPTPDLIKDALANHLASLTQYPATKGLLELRCVIAKWLTRRFKLPAEAIDPEHQILPCSGTREALFALAQALIDPTRAARVVMPNPFYQIYEGAALLAGGTPTFLQTTRETDYLPDFDAVPDALWNECQLVYLCSPGNPTGAILPATGMAKLMNLAEKFDFVVASDECYSELYMDENNPPQGLLEVAHSMGNTDFKRCIVFHSLSKRSNAPGLRSGFIAGDKALMSPFLRYRTYHGAALSIPVQYASMAAWGDEQHVIANRALYREKFKHVAEILGHVMTIKLPPAGFYLWPDIGGDDQRFARDLFAQEHVTILPGSFLSREAQGLNPGHSHVRLALVAPLDQCREAAHRITRFVLSNPSFQTSTCH